MADSTTSTGGPTPAEESYAKLDVLATQPLVAETRLDLQTEPNTPNDRWFIRNHYNIPRLDLATWRLHVGGAVDRPGQLTLDDLRSLPARQLRATLECAGNGRSYLPPPTDGNPFKYGAVSTASWAGPSLADVLARFGLQPGTQEIVFRGADRGFEKNVGKEINFERSLPLEIATHPDTILAYEMNGEPLPVEHGFPLRLVVPGWYGVASVKWLTGIEAIYRPFEGYFQRMRYILPGGPFPTPLSERRVRAVITSPPDGAVARPGEIEVRGLAWSGNQPVAEVQLSVDGGATWGAVELEPPTSAYAWQRWRAPWRAAPGRYLLQVRAADAHGRTQPPRAEWNLLGYANNGVQSISIEVRG